MTIRIIPTVLVNRNTVVKGKIFNNWRTVGNVYSSAKLLAARDVDEIIFLDTFATHEGRKVSAEFIRQFAEELKVPFGVGGGIKTLADAEECIRNGSEKVVLGDIIFDNPGIVSEIARELGSQAVVVSIDVGKDGFAYRKCGKIRTTTIAVELGFEMQDRGAGELLVQSIDQDGTMEGYNLDLIHQFATSFDVPILASGGAGKLNDFVAAAQAGAAGLCAGAFFQFTQFTPKNVRDFLRSTGIPVRKQVL
jgi:cyclase